MEKNNLLLIGVILVFTLMLAGCQNFINYETSEEEIFKYENLEGSFQLKTFSNKEQINEFIEKKLDSQSNFGYATKSVRSESIAMDNMASGTSNEIQNSDYSKTNIQVDGVDEADIVKTDGNHIYYVTNNIVYIVNTQINEIISKIEIENSYPNQIYINKNKLVVIGRQENRENQVDDLAVSSKIMPYPNYKSNTFVSIYDISDKKKPVLEEDITTEGYYFSSRMIGNHTYIIINKNIGPSFNFPIIHYNGGTREISAKNINYFDMPYSSHQLAIILSVDLKDNTFNEKGILKDSAQDIYVSNKNIYMINRKFVPYYYEQKKIIEEVIMKYLPEDVKEEIQKISKYDLREETIINEINYIVEKYFNTLDEEQRRELEKKSQKDIESIRNEIQQEREKTIINKISIDQKKVEPVATAEVRGYVLNQFSMDEFDENFRIATTTGNMWSRDESKNHLFVFDEDLKPIGKIEDIAPEERIYSVRFMGEKAYMVTFRNIDPLFVIDLSEPTNPQILGKLKIPGYSDYLHPYDENHIIGIGKSTEYDEKEDRVWQQGLKLALFDVSNVEKPKEIASIEIGDRGTDSDALYEHKAFLFSKEKNLLVLPVRLAEIDEEKYENDKELHRAYGDFTFQGAFVYNLTPENGFNLLGRITHIDDDSLEKSGYYYYSDDSILRSLYVKNSLYTLSRRIIKVNDLSDNLKKRIIGEMGHLSNSQTADYLYELTDATKTKHVFLAHLSKEAQGAKSWSIHFPTDRNKACLEIWWQEITRIKGLSQYHHPVRRS